MEVTEPLARHVAECHAPAAAPVQASGAAPGKEAPRLKPLWKGQPTTLDAFEEIVVSWSGTLGFSVVNDMIAAHRSVLAAIERERDEARALAEAYQRAVVKCCDVADTHTASPSDVLTIARRRDEARTAADHYRAELAKKEGR